MALFPSHWIHTGGDEAVKDQWKTSPLAQTRIRELGLRDENHLQSWMTARMSEWLAAHGRALIGWGEILEGGTQGLAPTGVGMSWPGLDCGVPARQGAHTPGMEPSLSP